MMQTTQVAAATFISALIATGAAAQSFEKYGDVEGWNVFIDNDQKSCLTEIVDEAENVVQMGLTEDKGVGYLGVFTKAETDIKKDATEEIAILIGEKVYVGEATGMRGNITEGYSGGYVVSESPEFVKDIEQQYEMLVFPEKEYAFVVNLTGTKKAIAMARECNEKLMN